MKTEKRGEKERENIDKRTLRYSSSHPRGSADKRLMESVVLHLPCVTRLPVAGLASRQLTTARSRGAELRFSKINLLVDLVLAFALEVLTRVAAETMQLYSLVGSSRSQPQLKQSCSRYRPWNSGLWHDLPQLPRASSVSMTDSRYNKKIAQ